MVCRNWHECSANRIYPDPDADRFDAGYTVDAIHKIEQIYEPQPDDRSKYSVQQSSEKTLEDRGGQKLDGGDHDGDLYEKSD